MKKITILLFSFMVTFAFSQVNINESFEGTTLPTDWTQAFDGFAGYSSTTSNPCSGSRSVRDNLWSSSASGSLITPNQVGASNGTDLTVGFDYKIINFTGGGATPAGWGTAQLQYSTDDGVNWTTVFTIDDGNHTASTSCAGITPVVIPGVNLPNGSDVKLRILNTWSTGDYYFYVDNFTASQVTLDPPNCDAVLTETTDVSISGNVSWSAATGVPTAYDLTVGTTSGGDDVLATTDVGNVTTFNIGTLEFSTTYYVTLVPKNDNGTATGCVEQTFVTRDAPTPPATIATININSCGDSGSATVTYNVGEVAWVEVIYAGGCDDLTVDTFASTIGDSEIGIYFIDGTLIGSNDDAGGGLLSEFVATGLPAGTYYAAASAFNTTFGAEFAVSTTDTDDAGDITITVSTPSNETADFVNLQFPFEATIAQGGTANVFAQIFEAGITEPAGQGAGIQAWIGVSDTNATTVADFETADWTWIPATYNVDNFNNDEYQAAIGAGLVPGTYYYVSRFSVLGGPFAYGGINPGASDGNFWDGANFVSGVLTVTAAPPPANDECSNATLLECGVPLTNQTTVAATGGSATSCVGSMGDDVWYVFNGNGDNVELVLNASLEEGQIGVYESTDGTCSGFTLGSCIASGGGSENPVTVNFSTTPGTSYYIRVGNWINGDPGVNFELTATCTTPCLADAGTLTADANPVELNGTTTISATPNGDINVPTDYEVTYVLTEGPTLVIQDVSTTAPSFDVTAAGDYTIHTLVAETSDSNDPNFLDLSVVQIGTTTGGDVLDIVTANDLCASLDVAGAPIAVLECIADAGTLTADEDSVLLDGTVTISATPNGDIVVPTDYEVIYVLTEGPTLVIQDVSVTSPSFEVTAGGEYTIHTLVAETSDNADPNFLDLSVVQIGVTTGGDVLDIINNNNLCASLDVVGAPITVVDINALDELLVVDLSIPNEVTIIATSGLSAATISGSNFTGFLLADFFGTAGTQIVTSTLVSGDLTSANQTSDNTPLLSRGGSGTDVGLNVWSYASVGTSTFTVGEVAFSGQATWTFSEAVYNAFLTAPASGLIYFPADTSDDIAGATLIGTYSVTTVPLNILEVETGQFTFYPNPVKNTLTLNAQNNIEQVTVFNMLGQAVIKTAVNSNNVELDMSNLGSGTYFAQVTINGVIKTVKVLKD
jgi:hypothetical protein